jgi:hypothetical protein
MVHGFAVEVAQFLQRFVISVQDEFFSFEVFVEMVHPPDGSGGLQEERRVIFLMVLELARSEGDGVEFTILVHLSEDGS